MQKADSQISFGIFGKFLLPCLPQVGSGKAERGYICPLPLQLAPHPSSQAPSESLDPSSETQDL